MWGRLIVGVLLLVLWADDTQSRHRKPHQQTSATKHQADPEQRGTEQSPFIVKIQQPEHTETKTESSSTEGPQQRGNGWLDGWSLSDKIAAVAIAVGLFQFLALVATVCVMMRTARRQLRAYICVDGGSIKLIQIGDTKLFQGMVSLKNFGQTPAYEARSWVRIDFLPADSDPFSLGSEGKGRTLIGPSSEVRLPVHHGPVTDADVAALRNHTKRIFVWGETIYKDVFGAERYFRFYHWDGDEIPGKGWTLGACDKPHEAN